MEHLYHTPTPLSHTLPRLRDQFRRGGRKILKSQAVDIGSEAAFDGHDGYIHEFRVPVTEHTRIYEVIPPKILALGRVGRAHEVLPLAEEQQWLLREGESGMLPMLQEVVLHPRV